MGEVVIRPKTNRLVEAIVSDSAMIGVVMVVMVLAWSWSPLVQWVVLGMFLVGLILAAYRIHADLQLYMTNLVFSSQRMSVDRPFSSPVVVPWSEVKEVVAASQSHHIRRLRVKWLDSTKPDLEVYLPALDGAAEDLLVANLFTSPIRDLVEVGIEEEIEDEGF